MLQSDCRDPVALMCTLFRVLWALFQKWDHDADGFVTMADVEAVIKRLLHTKLVKSLRKGVVVWKSFFLNSLEDKDSVFCGRGHWVGVCWC